MGNAWSNDGDSPSEKKESKHTSEKLTPDTSRLLVRVIEDSADHLHEELGVTNENAGRLVASLKEQLKMRNVSLGTILSNLSKECNHANELALVCFGLGRMTNNKSNSGPDSIGDLISQILRESRKNRGSHD